MYALHSTRTPLTLEAIGVDNRYILKCAVTNARHHFPKTSLRYTPLDQLWMGQRNDIMMPDVYLFDATHLTVAEFLITLYHH